MFRITARILTTMIISVAAASCMNPAPASTDLQANSEPLQESSTDLHGPYWVDNTASRDLPYHLLESSNGLEAEVVDRRVYDYAPRLRTDITGYAVFDVELTNHSAETVSINRSVNSCEVDGDQRDYDRDNDPATAITPVYVDLSPGQEVTLTMGCDTHDTSSPLEYILQTASSTSQEN